jgi:hypothetical protein
MAGIRTPFLTQSRLKRHAQTQARHACLHESYVSPSLSYP